MTQSIYITAMGPYSGKSVVSLGFVEMLSARLRRIGFFRPIVRSATEPDPQIELMRDRYQLQSGYDEMHGPTAEEVTALIARGAHEEVEKRVLTAYRELERSCDFVVCEGTDFVGSTPALDLVDGLGGDAVDDHPEQLTGLALQLLARELDLLDDVAAGRAVDDH